VQAWPWGRDDDAQTMGTRLCQADWAPLLMSVKLMLPPNAQW